jgi:hypothetical protein
VCRTGVFRTAIASIGPGIKLIGTTELLDIGIQGIGSVEGRALARVNCVSLSVARRFALPIAKCHDRVRTVFTRFEAIISWSVNSECQIRSIHFNGIIAIKTAHANIDRAGSQLNLDGAIVEVEK